MLYLTLFFRVLCHLLTISAPHLEKRPRDKTPFKDGWKTDFCRKILWLKVIFIWLRVVFIWLKVVFIWLKALAVKQNWPK